MRFFRADFVFCCFALAVQAQDLTPAERRRREYPEFANLAELAQSVTPELRAMILTRIGMQPSLKTTGGNWSFLNKRSKHRSWLLSSRE